MSEAVQKVLKKVVNDGVYAHYVGMARVYYPKWGALGLHWNAT